MPPSRTLFWKRPFIAVPPFLLCIGVLYILLLTGCSSISNSPSSARANANEPVISGEVTATRRTRTPTQAPEPTNTPVPTNTPEVRIHTVQAGETLGAIAAQYDTTVDELVEANNLEDPNRLSIGQALIVGTQEVDGVSSEVVTHNTPDDYPIPLPSEGLVVGEVTRIVDGDTIDVRVESEVIRLRLIGIDTPETVAPNTPVECFGREASDKAIELLTGQTVWLEADESQGDQDVYDRYLRYVWLTDGRLFNLEMIALGYANEYTYDLPYKYQDAFRTAQRTAAEQFIGLWSPETCGGDTAGVAVKVSPSAESTVPATVENPPVAVPVDTPTRVPETTIPPPTNTPLPLATDTPIPVPSTNTPIPVPPTEPPPPTATPEPPPPPPPAPAGQVVIDYVFYDGYVSRVESDEYAVITNVGGSPVNLSGWMLNAGDQGQNFYFPNYDLAAGASCRVYTNEFHPDSCGFSFGSGRAIWNNDGDCGFLFDNGGNQVSQYCY